MRRRGRDASLILTFRMTHSLSGAVVGKSKGGGHSSKARCKEEAGDEEEQKKMNYKSLMMSGKLQCYEYGQLQMS